jgi:serine/threonine protein kinase
MPQPSQPTGPFPGAAPPTGTASPAPPPSTSQDARVGSLIGQGKYRITGKLGQGGMGVVYEAEDVLLGRRVAVKLLPESVAGNSHALERFLREARAAARLNHPNVIAVFDVDQRDGDAYIVMELIRGGSAADLVAQRGPLPWPEATRIIADACRGLVAAHALGLIHRDIKPANILLHKGEVGRGKAESSAPPPMTVKLADFGLAKISEQTGTSLTDTGSVLGTPDYMSPEQCRSERLDDRSDIYSLGAAYFKLLTGQAPYVAETSLQILFAHCEKPVPDPCRLEPSISAACAAVVQRAMAKEPSARFQSAADMLAALETIPGAAPLAISLHAPAPEPPATVAVPVQPIRSSAQPAMPRRRRRLVPIGAGLLGIAALATAIWLVGRGPAHPSRSAALATNSTSLDFRREITERGYPLEVGGWVSSIAFTPDGRWLAVGLWDGAGGVRVWDLGTGQEIVHLWKEQRIWSVVFSADGKRLTAGLGHGLATWERGAAAGGPVGDLGGEVRALAYASPGQESLAVAINPHNGEPGRIQFRGPAPPALKPPVLSDLPAPIDCMAVSSDGQTLAVGCAKGFVRLWDLGTGKEWKNDLPHRAVSLAFSPRTNLRLQPEGSYVAIAAQDGLHFADLKETKEAVEVRDFYVLQGREVRCVRYSPDGMFWAAGLADGPVMLRNNVKGDLPAQFRTVGRHKGHVDHVAFSPDSKVLATGGKDKKVVLWNISRQRD